MCALCLLEQAHERIGFVRGAAFMLELLELLELVRAAAAPILMLGFFRIRRPLA